VDNDPPLDQLNVLMKEKSGKKVDKGECVVYWMRMEDVRCELAFEVSGCLDSPTDDPAVEDNRALKAASDKARSLSIPLVWLYVLSPGDYKWHDRSPRRIDFILRNLRVLQPQFDKLNIPLVIKTFDKRLTIPRRLVTEVFPELGAKHVFVNIEYEVDELRRDIAVVKRGREVGIHVECVHDRLIVNPGRIVSQSAGKPMSVFSPWQRREYFKYERVVAE
jgi:deoxyribodipyrimidine photo-lyase